MFFIFKPHTCLFIIIGFIRLLVFSMERSPKEVFHAFQHEQLIFHFIFVSHSHANCFSFPFIHFFILRLFVFVFFPLLNLNFYVLIFSVCLYRTCVNMEEKLNSVEMLANLKESKMEEEPKSTTKTTSTNDKNNKNPNNKYTNNNNNNNNNINNNNTHTISSRQTSKPTLNHAESIDILELIQVLQKCSGNSIRVDDFFPMSVASCFEPFLNAMGYGWFYIRPSPFCAFFTCLINTEKSYTSYPMTRLFDFESLFNQMIPMMPRLQDGKIGLWNGRKLKKVK
jgi:hypothetical protein